MIKHFSVHEDIIRDHQEQTLEPEHYRFSSICMCISWSCIEIQEHTYVALRDAVVNCLIFDKTINTVASFIFCHGTWTIHVALAVGLASQQLLGHGLNFTLKS